MRVPLLSYSTLQWVGGNDQLSFDSEGLTQLFAYNWSLPKVQIFVLYFKIQISFPTPLFLIFSLLSQLFFIFSLLSPCDIIGLVNIFPKTLGNNHPGRGKSLELWNRPYTGSGHDTLLITSAVSEMSQGEQVESVRCQDFLFDSHTGVSLDSLLHGLWVLSTREFLPSVLQDTFLSFNLKRN